MRLAYIIYCNKNIYMYKYIMLWKYGKQLKIQITKFQIWEMFLNLIINL